MRAQRYLAPFGHAFDLKMGRIRGIKGDTYLGSTSGKAVLYFLTRPPILGLSPRGGLGNGLH